MGVEVVESAIQRLTVLSHATIDLQQMGYDTGASLKLLGGADFSTNVEPDFTARVLAGHVSMADCVGHPAIRRILEIYASSHTDELDLLAKIIPPSANELMKEHFLDLNGLINPQDNESLAIYMQNRKTLRQNYLSSGGYSDFAGSLRWGVIDNAHILPQMVGGILGVTAVKFGVRFATILPHVRYSCVFTADMDGSAVNVKQALTVNPRVAMMVDGFDEWYHDYRAAHPENS